MQERVGLHRFLTCLILECGDEAEDENTEDGDGEEGKHEPADSGFDFAVGLAGVKASTKNEDNCQPDAKTDNDRPNVV